ncbi:hypothetical protein TNCV_3074931 [Trichonephila clavipes]|nr:hypothetical protein TNCV_3074931 [Trichonephila clavipes]
MNRRVVFTPIEDVTRENPSRTKTGKVRTEGLGRGALEIVGGGAAISSAWGIGEADEPTNLEQPTLNHVQSDTMASAVLADLTRGLQGTNRGSGTAIEKLENDVGSLELLLLEYCPWETI